MPARGDPYLLSQRSLQVWQGVLQSFLYLSVDQILGQPLPSGDVFLDSFQMDLHFVPYLGESHSRMSLSQEEFA